MIPESKSRKNLIMTGEAFLLVLLVFLYFLVNILLFLPMYAGQKVKHAWGSAEYNEKR